MSLSPNTLRVTVPPHVQLTNADYRKWITPREVVKMAAEGGAVAINMKGSNGEIKPGYAADLVSIFFSACMHACVLSLGMFPVLVLHEGRSSLVVRQTWSVPKVLELPRCSERSSRRVQTWSVPKVLLILVPGHQAWAPKRMAGQCSATSGAV